MRTINRFPVYIPGVLLSCLTHAVPYARKSILVCGAFAFSCCIIGVLRIGRKQSVAFSLCEVLGEP